MTDETNPKDLIGATKPDLSLVPASGIVYEALAMMDGKAKYGAYNWREKKVQMMTYLAAILRHTYALIDGEDFAQDSGRHHLGHIKATAGIIIDALETGNLIDNRPKPGVAAALIEKFTVKKAK